MADHDDRERFLLLAEAIIGAFAYVRRILADELPLPVIVPDFDPDKTEQSDVLLAFDRARELIRDEPIPHGAKQVFENLVLDLLTAYEIMALTKLAGPAPWRLDVVEFTLARVSTWGEVIELGEFEELDDDS